MRFQLLEDISAALNMFEIQEAVEVLISLDTTQNKSDTNDDTTISSN